MFLVVSYFLEVATCRLGIPKTIFKESLTAASLFSTFKKNGFLPQELNKEAASYISVFVAPDLICQEIRSQEERARLIAIQ
jgi:hypothetical protein